MPTDNQSSLCGSQRCRKFSGHTGRHSPHPSEAWSFFDQKDKDKLGKAGFATPRGGAKGAYQNHVIRSNRVIIPYERVASIPLNVYKDGYVIRLLPEQYFERSARPKQEFRSPSSQIVVGENAFVLYRTHESFSRFPPLRGWEIRGLVQDGRRVSERGEGIEDTGHYVLRLPTLGSRARRDEGPPQGIFAPEYADADTNYLCKCVLAWLTIHTVESPYTTSQAILLKTILEQERLLDDSVWEYRGTMRHGLTACPLCSKFIHYPELHDMLRLDEEEALENAAVQVEGATRSTIVNLFHLDPLRYGSVEHLPSKVAWGHATCNTRLGQRKCFPLQELIDSGAKVGIIRPDGIETFGWISTNWEMIRSPRGSVWIRLCDDGADEPPTGESPPSA